MESVKLADKHNEGKPELSLVPPIFWQTIMSNYEPTTQSGVLQNISAAAHSSDREDFLKNLRAAWFSIYSWQGQAYMAEGLAEVMAFGAKKYSRNNWKKGFKYTHMLDAALRHTLYFYTCDKETGLNHWKHVIFCLTMLFHMVQEGIGVNDLEWTDELQEVQEVQEVHNTGLGD